MPVKTLGNLALVTCINLYEYLPWLPAETRLGLIWGTRAHTLVSRTKIPQAPTTVACAASLSNVMRWCSFGHLFPQGWTLQCDFPRLRLCTPTEPQLSRTLPENRNETEQ